MTDRRRTFSDRRSMPDPEPHLRAWLTQPVELPESDLARIAWLVHQTPQQRRWSLPHLRSSAPMFTALKLTAAGAILASVGLFLFNATPTQRTDLPAVSPTPTAESILAPSASPAVSLAPSASPVASPVASGSPVASSAPVALGPVVLQLEPADGTRVGDWVKVGARPSNNEDGTGWGQLRDLQAIDEVLVAITTLSYPDETMESMVLASIDGLAWSRMAIEGDDPRFNQLVRGTDALMLAGSVKAGDKRAAALWTSTDGITWTSVPAPEGRAKVDRVVVHDPALTVVITGNRLWISRDGGAWEDGGGTIEVLRPQQGPGGFVSCCDIGDGVTTGMFWNDAAWTTGRELGGPPKEDGKGWGPATDARLHVVGDDWVLVPGRDNHPDGLFTSPDGQTDWTKVPRPEGLVGEELRWMTEVDGQAMAYGLSLEDGGTGAIWAWTVGEEAPPKALMPRTDEDLSQPAAWGDGWAAIGEWRSEASEMSLWSYQPER